MRAMTKRPPAAAAEPEAPYTVPEAAALLRISTTTLRNWIAQGVLVAIRPGRNWLIPRREVERLLTPSSSRGAAS